MARKSEKKLRQEFHDAYAQYVRWASVAQHLEESLLQVKAEHKKALAAYEAANAALNGATK